MEARAWRELPKEELWQKLFEIRRELVLLKMKRKTGQLPNTAVLRSMRRDVARILTILRERESEAGE